MEADGSLLLEENAIKIVNFIDVLCVSLDSPNRKINDEIRGKEGSYDGVINGIKRINAFKKSGGTPKIFVNCVILDKNYREMEVMAEFIQKLKVDGLIFRPLLFTDEETQKEHKKELQRRFQIKTDIFHHRNYKPENIDLEYLIEIFKKIKAKKLSSIEFFPNFEPIELKNYYSNYRYIPRRFSRCRSVYFAVIVLPDYNLTICPGYSIGNIKEQSFNKMWNNEKAKMFRKSLLKDGLLPNCRVCEGIFM